MKTKYIHFSLMLLVALIWSSCSNIDDNLSNSNDGKLVSIAISVGNIMESIPSTRNLEEAINSVEEIGNGYFMETSISQDIAPQTKGRQVIEDGVICRMLIYKNSISSNNYHKTIEFRVGDRVSLELPANSRFKVVCYSYNSSTKAPEFSLSSENDVNSILVTTTDGVVEDLLRSEGDLVTSNDGGTYTIKFKHVFSRAKLRLETKIAGQQITACTARLNSVITDAEVFPSNGSINKGSGQTSVSFIFADMNLPNIESGFRNIIASNDLQNVGIDQITIQDSQNPNLLTFKNKTFRLPKLLSEGVSYSIVQSIQAGAIVYKSDDKVGDVILQAGETVNFTFYNPLNDGFYLEAYEKSPQGVITPIVTSITSPDQVKSIAIPAYSASLGNRKIYFRYYNIATSKWYEMPMVWTQRAGSTINIMTMGQIQIYNAAWEATNPTTYISSKHTYNGYSAGLRPLLENKTLFGPAGKVPYTFKFFNLFNLDGTEGQVGRNYDLRSGQVMVKSTKQVLEENNIDILCVYWDWLQTPTPEQVAQMLDWLAADPHRGLIFSFDYYKYYGETATSVGRTFGSSSNSSNHWLLDGLNLSDWGESGRGGGTANFHLLSSGDIGYNDIEYTKIIDGTFGSVRETRFRAVDNDYGWVTQNLANREGYVPILLDGNNRVVMAVHPNKRIFFHGELQFLESGVMGPYGDVNLSNGYGRYAMLMGNTWAWFVERVVMGEKFE